MPEVSEENYLLNRRFVRACDAIIADETIPQEKNKYGAHVEAKKVPSSDYGLIKYQISPEQHKDVVKVETTGYAIRRSQDGVYDSEWIYVFDNDMVSSPWTHGFKIPTNYVSYFDVKPTRRNSAGRKHIEKAVNHLENDILQRFSNKPITELTDAEIMTEFHMLIGQLMSIKEWFKNEAQDFYMIWEGVEGSDLEEAYLYSMGCPIGIMQILSKKRDIQVQQAIKYDGDNKIDVLVNDGELNDFIRRYVLIMRELKKNMDLEKSKLEVLPAKAQ